MFDPGCKWKKYEYIWKLDLPGALIKPTSLKVKFCYLSKARAVSAQQNNGRKLGYNLQQHELCSPSYHKQLVEMLASYRKVKIDGALAVTMSYEQPL
eukprot:1154480-Pelagomonas_calceolata.AAC.5